MSKQPKMTWFRALILAIVFGILGYQWYLDQTQSNSALDSPVATSEFLEQIGNNRFQSPAGLVYTMGPGGEHRIDHVLRHAQDQPSRPVHGVFDGDRMTILQLLDEAYGLVKSKSKQVKSESSHGNMAHTISLQRRIGYEGGQKGKRNRHPDLKRLRMILNDNRVITAYPSR